MSTNTSIPLASEQYQGRASEPTPGVDLDANQHGSTDEGHAHPVPKWVLISVFGGLLVLTVLTVAMHFVDLGPFNIWVAMAIAVAKAMLVAMFFMHLWWDSPFNGMVLFISLALVALFISMAIMDSSAYQPTMEPPNGYSNSPLMGR